MSEVKFEKSNWVYAGRKKGKPKFKWQTNQTLEQVKAYLDSKGIDYLVHESTALIFIYRTAKPESEYAPRYAYYYTTGRWGDDTRRKHYQAKNIEDFVTRFYIPLERDYD